jgi:uncharacterized protein (TIRG00374 family)
VTSPKTGLAKCARYLGAVLAAALVAAVIAVAGPDRVWQVLSQTDPGWLLAAGLGAGLATVLRGLRLALLLPAGRLGPGRSALVAAAAQAAALFLPLRLGELALPWLLRRAAAWDAAAGVGTLLVARTLDLVALGAWAGAGVVLLWGVQSRLAVAAAIAMLAPPLMLPLLVRAADRLALCLLAPWGVRGRRWARRIRRLSRAMWKVKQHPGRLAAAALASLAMWGLVWAYTWLLLTAMGFRWPVDKVVAGSAAASLANLIPVNLVANLGTLEAGWTAAFHALGFSIEEAAASGLAAHLWALVFAAVYGACAWIMLTGRTPAVSVK